MGSSDGKTLVAGKGAKTIEYVLVESSSMRMLDRLTVKDENGWGTKYVKMARMGGSLVAVCCRLKNLVDILQVNGEKLSMGDKDTVDLGVNNYLYSIVLHECSSTKSSFLIGGSSFLKRLDIKIK